MARSNNDCWPKPLLAMIGASHSPEAMQQFRDYVPDDRAWNIFKEMSQSMLTAVRPEGSSCVIMSALLATMLEEPLDALIPVVAGALKLDGDYMYGSDRGFDGGRVFSGEEGEDWDGHCWLLLGEYIVDISLGRTAREGHCRAPLAQRILSEFGPHAGMIALTEKGARDVGLRYLPRYVLSPDQVLANAGGAMHKFGLMDE
ncbi:MAG: hypothetical protein ABI454_10395 [Sphingomicrobium sp.]